MISPDKSSPNQDGTVIYENCLVDYWLRPSEAFDSSQLLFRVYHLSIKSNATTMLFNLPKGFLNDPQAVYITEHPDDGLACFAFHACTTRRLQEETGIVDYFDLYKHEPLIKHIQQHELFNFHQFE